MPIAAMDLEMDENVRSKKFELHRQPQCLPTASQSSDKILSSHLLSFNPKSLLYNSLPRCINTD